MWSNWRKVDEPEGRIGRNAENAAEKRLGFVENMSCVLGSDRCYNNAVKRGAG